MHRKGTTCQASVQTCNIAMTPLGETSFGCSMHEAPPMGPPLAWHSTSLYLGDVSLQISRWNFHGRARARVVTGSLGGCGTVTGGNISIAHSTHARAINERGKEFIFTVNYGWYLRFFPPLYHCPPFSFTLSLYLSNIYLCIHLCIYGSFSHRWQ